MNPLRRLLLWTAACAAFATAAFAEDPSDLFLNAYQDFQAGERFERDANLRSAFEKFQNAERLLEQITKVDATWQPSVVEFRLRKTRENIQRLAPEVAKLPPDDIIEGPLPQADPSASLPPPAVNTSVPIPDAVPQPERPRRSQPDLPRPQVAPSPTPPGGNSEIARLQRQLADQKRENERLAGRLARQAAELKSALFEVDRTKVTVVELRSQLVQAQDALNDAKNSPAAPAAPVVPKELADQIQQLEAERDALQEENDRLVAKLDRASKYIEGSDAARKLLETDRKAVARERDEALTRTKRIRDNQKEIDRLTAERDAIEKRFATEKKDLQTQLAAATDPKKTEKLEAQNKKLAEQLAAAEKKISELADSPARNEEALNSLKSEVNGLNDRLLEAQAQISGKDEQLKALTAQLDETSGDLARLRLNPEPNAEDKRVITENELLRGIILRQIKAQAEREAAGSELKRELDRLQVKSEELNRQLQVLASPAIQLTDQEQTLFREPTALIREPSADTLDVSMAVTKPTSDGDAPKGAASLTTEARSTVEKAREAFEAGRFDEAEKLYQQIADESPDNYFVLSNLGVTQIQARKLSAAEVALRKAVQVNPKDAFAATNLGIVYCKQGRFDEAIASLREAIAADPNDHVAFNYLGVCLGEKGQRQDAEEQFKQSVALHDDYADAHFNLAVLYATSQPPNMSAAKEHYDKAVKAGANPDPSLEHLINTPQS